jgi:Amt family ammonium transporter
VGDRGSTLSALDAAGIGAIAGIVMVFGVELLEWLRIDDPIGGVAVHGFCGIWGTLSLGFLVTGQYGVPSSTGAGTLRVSREGEIEGLDLHEHGARAYHTTGGR